MKVFCDNCEHSSYKEMDECRIKDIAKKCKNYYEEFYEYKKMSVLNKNNDCKYYYCRYEEEEEEETTLRNILIKAIFFLPLLIAVAAVAAYFLVY